MNALRIVIRLILTGLFVWAAAVKILDPRALMDAIQSYHLLPWIPATIVAVWLPWLELVLACALWVRSGARTAAGMLAALCAVFLIALVQAWARGIDITCGCFGSSSVVSGGKYALYLARDTALIALAVVLWRLETKAAPDPSGAASTPDFAD